MTGQVNEAEAEARLRDLQSITDAALSRLDDHDFLPVLLDRARDILRADTAAVLLLDSPSGQLVAAAAAGLEEEVRQGVRIPVGRGFAGRVAATGRPVILDHVDHTTVLNPILMAKGIRSMLGVPLIAEGKVIGVLHVGSLTPRRFTSDDASLLQLAADRAALAVQSLRSADDRIAAQALQRSLLPSALPMVPGVQIAARYVPGSGVVGGDWYDVFVLPSGELGVVIGDVAGSGLAAAVVMGRMRSALRAYAMETMDPAEVLGRLDRKMQHFEPGALATVLYAVLDPALDRAYLSSAGHLAPVTAVPGEAGELAEIAPGLMIGVDPRARRRVSTVKIAPGAVLCLYTDGLVERRQYPLDEGLARLCGAVTAQPPEQVCASVMGALVGSTPARDDIALVALRRMPPGTPGT
ncbi:MAG TPA: GAF domain-containing SpoIIE family protein phosphatase [Streptosporangiaceae bacterium]